MSVKLTTVVAISIWRLTGRKHWLNKRQMQISQLSLLRLQKRLKRKKRKLSQN
ncbi:Uncharacterised protein [Vibrio cholerae]|nr:Uncharacterised protein [Vibrio cholerae]